MRIDIIVPNFDETSDEVTLSTWYKKVGEKISKGEVIADAETSTIACGITSSYDCVLAKILVQEGEIIGQGTKIAVIETDLSADISDIEEEKIREDTQAISDEISEQVEREATIASEKIAADVQKNMEMAKFLTRREEKKQIERQLESENSNSGDLVQNDQSSYTLSVPLGEEIQERSKDIVSEIIENRRAEETEIVRDIIDNSTKIEEEVIDHFSNQAERKLKNMIKNAEQQAKAEAEKLKQRIISEAQKQAKTQAEALKTKILQECENRAMRDANEMHQRIIQGSISEAESTKSKLLDDARVKAQKEAEELKSMIINNAETAAKEMANAIRREKIEKAKREAEEKAELLSKEIIEKAISESKADARAVKKDILHSAHKHIAKEAEGIIRAARKEAQVMSEMRIKELMSVVMMFAEKEAEAMKAEVIQSKKQIIEASKNTEKEIEKIKEEITHSSLHAKGLISSMIHHTETKINEIKKDIDQAKGQVQDMLSDSLKSASNKAGQLEATILSEAKHTAENRANEILTSTFASMQEEIGDIKIRILEQAKEIAIEQAKEVIGATNRAVLENICQLKKELLKSAETAVHSSITSVVDSVKNDVTKTVLRELKQGTQKPCGCGTQSQDTKIQSSSNNTNGTSSSKTGMEGNSSQEQIIRKLMNTGETEGSNPDTWNKPKFLETPNDKSQEIDLVRRRLSERRTDTYDTSVISTVSNEVDMSAVIALEQTFGQQFTEKYNTRLGFTPFFIKAAIDALKRFKIFNAHVYEGEIIYKEDFDISIITYGNDGVAAPVIRQANKMSIAEIEKAMISLSKRALDGTLSVEEVSGGTFTVINAGIYGSMIGTDLLTPPQVATLSVHKMKNKPVATSNGIEVKPILYISLSYDHRVSDTKQASEFLSYIRNFVENPGWQLLGLGE